jgi:hypothetical protein
MRLYQGKSKGHVERKMAGACRMQESSGNPTSGANQHLVAHAGASFQDEAASILLLQLLRLQVGLQMPRYTYPSYGCELSLQ